MQKITVVVPVYNVEKYLKKCLDSIVKQTYKNLEIILVDDGSTDGSRDICDVYGKKDERIQIIRQKNQGLSAARNTGIAAASGESIIFIDSDDYIAENMLEILVGNLEENHADIATCGIYNVYQNGITPQYKKNVKYVCDNIEAYRKILIGNEVPASICNKLIRKECINDLRFPVGRHYEDAFFHIDLMQKVRKVCIDTRPLYYYVHRKGSITTKKYQQSSYDVVVAYEKNMDMIMKKYPQLYREAEFRMLWGYLVVLDRMLQEEEYWRIEGYQKVISYLKKSVGKICRNPYFTKARKISVIALAMDVRIYRILAMRNHKNRMEIS